MHLDPRWIESSSEEALDEIYWWCHHHARRAKSAGQFALFHTWTSMEGQISDEFTRRYAERRSSEPAPDPQLF